jgi:hypothetical protein
MAILSAISALIQPEVFECGFQVIEALYCQRIEVGQLLVMAKALSSWGTPHTGLIIINDRQTPLHRDFWNSQWAFDLIATFGYYEECRFECRTLGRAFVYDPGCVMAGLTRYIQHGASEALGDPGTRLCIKATFRDAMMMRSVSWAQCPLNSSDGLSLYFYQDTPGKPSSNEL